MSSDRYVLFDTTKSLVVKELKHNKKTTCPVVVDISQDDKFAIEIHPNQNTSVHFRNLISNTITAKFEGHSQSISNISFTQNTD